MPPAKILLQLDCDPQPSVFDSVVAADAGVDHLLRHGGVQPKDVQGLVQGAIFTRKPEELKYTAVFIGGSDVYQGEALLDAARASLFDPFRVSVMMDSNGSNTTAAAAVLTAKKELPLKGVVAVVLGATGPVGQRVARLLARQGAVVRVGSRDQGRAELVCQNLSAKEPGAELIPVGTASEDAKQAALQGTQVLVAAGAFGKQLLQEEEWRTSATLKVVIDLNAVPDEQTGTLGIGGVAVHEKGTDRDGIKCYGAVGVGGSKMKIHRAALQKLFESNDQVLNAKEIFDLGENTLG
ncbi:MAG: methylenetetrahydromethanopterin dehydrogenase [Planctomycetales bacterium]